MGFPGGSVVKNLPASAGDLGLIPNLRRSHILQSIKVHAPQLLSPCSRAWKPQLLSPCAASPEVCVPQSLCSATREATALRSLCTIAREYPPLATTREEPEQQQRPSIAKINK